jgi:FkbM family methyltransferase
MRRKQRSKAELTADEISNLRARKRRRAGAGARGQVIERSKAEIPIKRPRAVGAAAGVATIEKARPDVAIKEGVALKPSPVANKGRRPERWTENAAYKIIPHRLAAISGSARRQRQAAERERDFSERSASYREAEGPPEGAECVEIAGLRWYIPASEREADGFASRMLNEAWLPIPMILRTRRLGLGGIALDVGANVGTTSIPRAVLGDFEAIYCAEPEPANYAALVANVRGNGLAGFVLPDRVAVGAEDGSARLALNTGIARHALLREGREVEIETIDVPIRSLDSWVEGLGLDPYDISFIKTDCQGWEPFVLAGASRLLEYKHIAWQIEYWPFGMKSAGASVEDVLALLRARFTHAHDLGMPKNESVTTDELPQALAYLERGSFTDLLLYNA